MARIADVMSLRVLTVTPDETVQLAIARMLEENVGSVAVCEGNHLVGIFTERDVLRCYLAAGGRLFAEIPLRDAMTTNLVVAELDDDLADIMAVMNDRNIRHLPVVENGALIGMLSVRDVIQSQVQKLTSEIHYLKDYIASA